jgi:hypothetical protein
MRLDGIDYHRSDRSLLAALNGMMLFGLSTAFLFAVSREPWPTRARRYPAEHEFTRFNDFSGLAALSRNFFDLPRAPKNEPGGLLSGPFFETRRCA